MAKAVNHSHDIAAAAHGASASVKELLALRAHAIKVRGKKPQKTAMLSGQYVSKTRGRGLEFAEVRHYQAGDDVRSIDWRISARSGKTHTRIYAEEREQPTFIMCDLGNNMHFGTRTRFKSTQAANIAALIAWSAQAIGDRAGGFVYAKGSHAEVKPSRSAKSVALFLGLIAERFPDLSHSSSQKTAPISEHSDSVTEAMLSQARRLSGHGGKVFLISDFSHWNAECDKQLALLCRHNDCHLIAITDPFEASLPKQGLFPVSNGQGQIILQGGKHNASLSQLFSERMNALSSSCRRYKASFSHIKTNDDPIDALAGFIN